MTTTAHRRARRVPGPHRAAPAGERMLDPGVRAEVCAIVGQLVDSAAAQAREAGRHLRCILRLWLLAEEDREIEWVASEGLISFEAAERVDALLETDDQLVLDVADEIGAALNLPAGTALDRVREALLLGLHLPETLEELEAGRFSARHASLMADQWRELVEDVTPGEQAPIEVVRRLVAEPRERAPHCTVAQLRAWSRRRRAALLAETQERRHRIAWAGRRVWVEHGEDGMAGLHAVLDAPTALAAQDRLDAFVARLGADGGSGAGASGVRRTEAQLRADVLADLLLAGEVLDDPSFCRDVRGEVSVTVPVLTLLGSLRGPAEGPTAGEGLSAGEGPTAGAVHCDAAVLSGYGPISAETARELAAGSTSWHRILTHPVTGAVLDHDRTAYAVPADLRRRLRHRDGTCRFPGCRRRAERCDLDHTVARQHGARTAADNLSHLCRHHHLVKHRDGVLGRWSVRQLGPQPEGGILEWTSTAGRTYRTVPDAPAAPQPDGLGSGSRPDPPPSPAVPAVPRPDPPPF